MDGGTEMSLEDIKADIESYVPPVSGVTFSGGDPMYQLKEVLELAQWAQTCGLRTTLYTGFSIEEVFSKLSEEKCSFSDAPFNYIIDGCYNESQKSLETAFRGSSNQKIYKKVLVTGDDFDYIQIEINDKGEEV
jgi:anaerobic ribonucleoside-triphosphate reductase activating protein